MLRNVKIIIVTYKVIEARTRQPIHCSYIQKCEFKLMNNKTDSFNNYVYPICLIIAKFLKKNLPDVYLPQQAF